MTLPHKTSFNTVIYFPFIGLEIDSERTFRGNIITFASTVSDNFFFFCVADHVPLSFIIARSNVNGPKGHTFVQRYLCSGFVLILFYFPFAIRDGFSVTQECHAHTSNCDLINYDASSSGLTLSL